MRLLQTTQGVKSNEPATLNRANQAIGWMKQHKIQAIAGAVGSVATVGLIACGVSGVAWPILAGLGAVALTGWTLNAIPLIKDIYQEESKKLAQADRKQTGETLIEMITPELRARTQRRAKAAQAKADAADRQIGARQAAKSTISTIAVYAISAVSAGAIVDRLSPGIQATILKFYFFAESVALLRPCAKSLFAQRAY